MDVSDYIHLVSSNKKAQIINEKKLSKLPDPIYTFKTNGRFFEKTY